MTDIKSTSGGYASDEFFAIASAVDILTRAAEAQSPKALIAASRTLDLAAPDLVRGCAYLGWLLSQAEQSDFSAEASRSARQALVEMNALAAVLTEMKSRADSYEAMSKLVPAA